MWKRGGGRGGEEVTWREGRKEREGVNEAGLSASGYMAPWSTLQCCSPESCVQVEPNGELEGHNEGNVYQEL